MLVSAVDAPSYYSSDFYSLSLMSDMLNLFYYQYLTLHYLSMKI
jgi:hypothetical protein